MACSILRPALPSTRECLGKCGILRSDLLREPCFHLEEAIAEEMDALIDLGLSLCQEVAENSGAWVQAN
jgi:hypothetical protein